MEASGGSPNDRLGSWKEIAAYLDRGVRTVQRWERDEGLPVQRLPHERRGTVYAYRHELDAWWKSRGAIVAATEPTEADRPSPSDDRGGRRRPAAIALVVSRWRWSAVVAGVALATVVTVGAVRLWVRESPQPLTLQRLTTTTGRTLQTALSADGKMVAYVSDAGRDEMPAQVWVQQIGSPTAIQLTRDDRRHAFPSFSADGTRVLFTRVGLDRSDVYEVPALGGAPKLLVPNAGQAVFSPDGRWIAYGAMGRVHLTSADGTPVRDVTGRLVVALAPVWSPDSTKLLVTGTRDAAVEPDWWIVPIDGGEPIETGLVRTLREKGFQEGWLRVAPVWTSDNDIVFSGRNRDGWSIWKQRLDPSGVRPEGDPERITTGTAVEWWPSAAAGRLTYVSSHPDNNIWSLPADTNAGTVTGPMRRLTRGSGVTAYLSLSSDGRTLAFASDRTGDWDIYVKDLAAGTEAVLAGGPDRQMYSALSHDGSHVAYGVVSSGEAIKRPVFVATIANGTIRQICDDCNGRPRVWMPDLRRLLLERFSRFNSIALIDTTTGEQVDLLVSKGRAVSNPRVSRDGQWVAFQVGARGRAPRAFVARMNGIAPVPESEWIPIQDVAALPFWSPDGRLVYYLTGTFISLGSQMIRAQRFDPVAARVVGEPFDVFALEGATVPAPLTSGAGLTAAPDQIVMTLADFQGDVWVTSLPGRTR